MQAAGGGNPFRVPTVMFWPAGTQPANTTELTLVLSLTPLALFFHRSKNDGRPKHQKKGAWLFAVCLHHTHITHNKGAR